MNKSCRTCKHYSPSYGFRNGAFVGLYISCDFKESISVKCKKNNFKKWENKLKEKGNKNVWSSKI